MAAGCGRAGKTSAPSRPATIHNQIYDCMQRYRAGYQGSTASIPEQIDQLDQLRRRGVISEAEFRAKKADLLDRL